MVKVEKANAYSALLGAVAGTVGTIVVASFFLGGQWERWVEIRDAHKSGNVVNTEIDLSGFVSSDELPDVSSFALKSQIPSVADFITFDDLPPTPDLSTYALREEIPDVSQFASRSDLPELSNYARATDIPDTSIFVSTSTFADFVQSIGSGETRHPTDGSTTSALCPEGFAMVGVKYTVASGGNAGALYHGLYPVCRSLVR